ncbi:MAG: hypothetical protein HQK88_05060 [Nitrospirae bacterium]|nr:hypothetical protein [Nitrospirota bacterium]MBF0534014.1 hypothetical protein [Nitrospirota bacterium]MBF0616173.1 hypothetical protein [Nitrospirota bacterium]
MDKLTDEARDAILVSMNEGIKALNKKVDVIETRLDKLETSFDGLETRFDGLETRFDGLDVEVKSIKKELAKKPDEDKVRQIVREELGNASFSVEQPIKLKRIS